MTYEELLLKAKSISSDSDVFNGEELSRLFNSFSLETLTIDQVKELSQVLPATYAIHVIKEYTYLNITEPKEIKDILREIMPPGSDLKYRLSKLLLSSIHEWGPEDEEK